MLFFDDQFPIHRKVARLSDAAYRLHSSAIFWCARNLTDGVVPEEDLEDVCAQVRTPERFVAECVKRRLWHEIGTVCDSEKCPAYPSNGVTNEVAEGWVIHDYFDWQKTKERVKQDRAANAERQRKFRERRNGVTENAATSENIETGQRNAVSNAVTNASVTQPSPVQSPSRRDGTSLGGQSAGGQSVRAGARVREARRMLHQRYGLTDDEADQVIGVVSERSKEPIKNISRYLDRMAEGDLADIVGAVMDARTPRPEPAPPPDPPPLSVVPETSRVPPSAGPSQPPLLVLAPEPAPDPEERARAEDALAEAHRRLDEIRQNARPSTPMADRARQLDEEITRRQAERRKHGT